MSAATAAVKRGADDGDHLDAKEFVCRRLDIRGSKHHVVPHRIGVLVLSSTVASAPSARERWDGH
jgi:hypothetical protein